MASAIAGIVASAAVPIRGKFLRIFFSLPRTWLLYRSERLPSTHKSAMGISASQGRRIRRHRAVRQRASAVRTQGMPLKNRLTVSRIPHRLPEPSGPGSIAGISGKNYTIAAYLLFV